MGKLVRPLQSGVLHSPKFKVDTVKYIKAMLWSASDISRFQAVLQIGAWSKHEELFWECVAVQSGSYYTYTLGITSFENLFIFSVYE